MFKEQNLGNELAFVKLITYLSFTSTSNYDPDFCLFSEPLLKEKKYLHILDRNCAQFEPDHPDYIRVAEVR